MKSLAAVGLHPELARLAQVSAFLQQGENLAAREWIKYTASSQIRTASAWSAAIGKMPPTTFAASGRHPRGVGRGFGRRAVVRVCW